ncbi:MAG: PQQ-binding-like beta-propeller repeat protein, partial [bacterium]|nr:PQQ-binding-like beta-propeller repeat protein [bacterium]
MSCDEKIGKGRVVCVSVADGKTVWTKDFRLQAFKRNRDNSMAASTPAVNAERVVVCWASAKAVAVVALDHDGKQLWHHSLGAHKTKHGPCCTPVLHRGIVYVANDNQGASTLLAIDAASGKVKWRVERAAGLAAYGTPLIYRSAGGAEHLVMSSTAAGLTGYDLDTGKRLWRAPDVNPLRVVASPVQVGELVITSSGTGGRGKWIIAVKPPTSAGGRAKTAWKDERNAPYVPTCLAVGELLFTVHDSGAVACYRAATGEVVWRDKLPDRFYGSPVCVGGRIYVIGRKGTMF